MPIRFRCAYCNQLLGIARRKVGSIVRCPTCAGQVVVPEQDAEGIGDDSGSQPVFERDDFDALLSAPAAASHERETKAGPVAVEPAGSWGTHAEPAFDVERLYPNSSAVQASDNVQSKAGGIVLSPMKATLLTIAFIATVALSFFAGLGVGYLLFHVS